MIRNSKSLLQQTESWSFQKCFQNCNPFLNLEILPLKRKPARHWQSYYRQQEQHQKTSVQPLWGEGATGTTGMSMVSKTCSAAITSKATQGTSPTTPWPIPAIASSSTSAEWTAVGDEATGLVTGVNTNSRGCSGVVGSTGTDKGVCITGTGWGSLYQNPGSPGTNRKVRGLKLWG